MQSLAFPPASVSVTPEDNMESVRYNRSFLDFKGLFADMVSGGHSIIQLNQDLYRAKTLEGPEDRGAFFALISTRVHTEQNTTYNSV